MKRYVKILFVLALLPALAGIVVAGGTAEPATAAGSVGGAAGTDYFAKYKAEPISFPLVKEPVTLSIFWRLNPKATATLKDYADMDYFKVMAEKTGISMKFQHPPLNKETEQFNLMVASGQYPDLIYWENWTNFPGGPQKAIDMGMVIPLNENMAKYAPNFRKLIEEEPMIKKYVTTDEGNFYGFPLLRYKLSMKGVWGFIVREDWLDKVGLAKPETTDDWYTMLKAFREKDPNGNGKMDELPFSSQGMGRLIQFLYAWGIDHKWYNDNGVAKFGAYEPAYKDALTWLAKLYKEGLIDPEYAANDPKQLDVKVQANLVGSYWGETGGASGMYYRNWQKDGTNGQIVGVESPIAKKGMTKYNYSHDSLYNHVALAISTKNKYVKESVKYFDYGYSPEGNLLINFGPEGLTYTMVNGHPAFTPYVTNNPKGLSVDQVLASHALGSMQGPYVFNRDIRDLRMLLYPWQRAVSGRLVDRDRREDHAAAHPLRG